MADYSSCRIACYIMTILLHVLNTLYMRDDMTLLKEDPDLKSFIRFQARFFTCWNLGVQVIYATIALFCEFLILKNSSNKDYKLNKHLRDLRDILFAGILWPSTMVVFSVFWPLYIYDRELIFPKFVDKVLTPLSNHVIHTFIVPIALWEVIFQPRVSPRSHKKNLFHLLAHLSLYMSILVYTYNEHGMWLYPIFDKLYGTVYFPIAILSIVIMSVAFYYLQWTITSLVWEKKAFKKNK